MPVNRRDDDEAQAEPPVAWHNQTSTLLGASVAGVLAIGLLVMLISYVAGQFSEPEQAPLNYIPPPRSSSVSATESATSTTTGTITSTSPPMTSDINPGETTTTSTSTTSTTRPTTRPPRTRETDDNEGEEEETTRSRPRTNVTRTLYPGT